MAVSVRMEALLERQLEMAAQRRGISKSQFIIDAVQRELGHKDPGKLLLQVRKEFAPQRAAEAAAGGPAEVKGSDSQKLRALLRAKHARALAEWSPPALPTSTARVQPARTTRARAPAAHAQPAQASRSAVRKTRPSR